jgi:membrane protein DedA with SNARE-associated domain
MFSLEQLLQNFGYPALLIGTFLEGETVLVLAGVAAKMGYLKLGWVILIAFVGTFLGDQLYFFLGRRHGKPFLLRHPGWSTRVEKAQSLLDRHERLLVVGFRFLYGLRTVTPFVIGMSGISTRRFFVLNAAGALVWATGFAILAYLFGHALELLLGDIKRYEETLFVIIVSVGAFVWAGDRYRKRKK